MFCLSISYLDFFPNVIKCFSHFATMRKNEKSGQNEKEEGFSSCVMFIHFVP